MARNSAVEFLVSIDNMQLESGLPVRTSNHSICWVPLSSDSVKLNCDGAFQLGKEEAAIGVICRDNFGHFRWGFVDKLKSIYAFMTIALGFKWVLLLAMDLGLDKAIFQSNCLILINCIDAKSLALFDWHCRSI